MPSIEIKPGLLVEDATFEMLDRDHWVALVVVRTTPAGRTERHWFALAPGYNPRKDGGAQAAEEIRSFLAGESNGHMARDDSMSYVPAPEFGLKDSGKREEFDSGMVRDTEDGKVDYSLVFDGPMFKRWAAHLTKGAKKYAARNWMKATGEEELERFKRSFLRHMVAYFDGQTDEDHAAAMIFNLNGIEYVKSQQTVKALQGFINDTATARTTPRPPDVYRP